MNVVYCAGEPVAPSKIVCVGRNYVEHIQELGNETPEQMLLFVKPNSAITDTLISWHQEPLHYEAELCFMVGAGGFCSVGVGLDLTKRQLQSELKAKGLPWERAKAFDGAALFSDFVPLEGELDRLAFTLSVDGVLRQLGELGLMIHRPAAIYREICDFMRLETGDIVMTGTPKGVGTIKAGERFTLTLLQEDRPLLCSSWQAL